MKCYCGIQGELFCKVCPKLKYFCFKHGKNHNNQCKHKVELIEDDIIHESISRSVEIEIQKCILDIIRDTQRMISSIEAIAENAIKKLRKINQNSKSLSDFKAIKLGGEKFDQILNQSDEFIQIVNFQDNKSDPHNFGINENQSLNNNLISGDFNSDFANLDLEGKRDHLKQYCKFIPIDSFKKIT